MILKGILKSSSSVQFSLHHNVILSSSQTILYGFWTNRVKCHPYSRGERGARHGVGRIGSVGSQPQPRPTLWLLCKQPCFAHVPRGRETTLVTQTCLSGCGRALLHQPTQLHGALHVSRLDDLLCATTMPAAWLHLPHAFGELTECYHCHAGVLPKIQEFFDIGDSMVALLQTGVTSASRHTHSPSSISSALLLLCSANWTAQCSLCKDGPMQ